MSLGITELTDFFLAGCQSRRCLRTGIEVEWPVVLAESGRAAPFRGSRSISAVIDTLTRDYGWRVLRLDAGYPIQLRKGRTELTLEVWGGIEFVGQPHHSLFDLAAEFTSFTSDLAAASRPLGLLFLGLGMQPVSRLDTVDHVDRPRWLLWRKHFARFTHRQMHAQWNRRAAALQINLDSTSPQNLAKKFNLLVRLSPILAAIFANSCVTGGRLTSLATRRYQIMQQIDRPRFVPPRSFFDFDFSLDRYVEHALDLPMIFIQRDAEHIPVRGLSFRQFLTRGYRGHQATLADWELHLGFIYTDVRLKRWIEFRPLDSLPTPLALSAVALVKGLLYHSAGWQLVEDLTRDWTYADYLALRSSIARGGLAARVRGQPLDGLARELVATAAANLDTFSYRDAASRSEASLLDPLHYFLDRGWSPAQWVAKNWQGSWSMRPLERLLEWSAVS